MSNRQGRRRKQQRKTSSGGNVDRPQTYAIAQTEFHAEMFQGPLPPAEYLERCEAIQPGFTNRVLSQWEDQSRHRHLLEVQAVREELGAQKRGQNYGLIVALAGFAVCGLAIVNDQELVAGIIASLDLGALVTVFVIGRRKVGGTR